MSTNEDLDDIYDDLEDATSDYEGESDSTSQEDGGRQSSGNWQDDPAYRELQAREHRQRAQMEKALLRAEQAAKESAQRVREMENFINQRNLEGLDGEAKYAEYARQLQRQLQELQNQRDLDAFAYQRQRDLEDIARATGVPFEEIEDAPNVHVAWQKAHQYAAQQNKQEDLAPRRQSARPLDDRVDVAVTPKPTSNSKKWQDRYDKAREAFEFGETLKIMAEAERRGVTIKEW